MGEVSKQEREQEMFRLIEQCHCGEMTNKAFCREYQLPEWKFYYWQNKYREYQQPQGFVPVNVSQSKSGTQNKIEIHYPNGIHIRLPQQTGMTMVKALIGIL
jgi:hypothetical protein